MAPRFYFSFSFKITKNYPICKQVLEPFWWHKNIKMTILKKILMLEETFFSSIGWVSLGMHAAYRKRIIHSILLSEQDL